MDVQDLFDVCEVSIDVGDVENFEVLGQILLIIFS